MTSGTTARRRPAVLGRWRRVTATITCANGGHFIAHGTWALFWPYRHWVPRYILCEAHAKAQGYARPTPAAPAGPDVKRRQTGEE